MRRVLAIAGVLLLLGGNVPPVGAATRDDSPQKVAALETKANSLERQLAEQRNHFNVQLEQMRAEIRRLSGAGDQAGAAKQDTNRDPTLRAAKGAGDDLATAISRARTRADASADLSSGWRDSGIGAAVQSLNPDISVIVDTFFHSDDSDEGIHHVFEQIAGFGHSHGDDGHSHSHLEDGFNMRHLELHLSGEVDPYFRAWAIGAFSESSAELEEAVIQSTCLPGGLQVQAGKFFSNFGRINPQHSHEWDFVDQPLIFALTLGDHGLNEKGLQLSWLAPTPFHLLLGGELFQGENEQMFHHLSDEELPHEQGPRLWVVWAKCGPNLPDPHGLQFGVSAARGVHQEAHDGDSDGTDDHWLDGYSTIQGVDMVYKYDSPQAHGQGDFVLQGEYLFRKKDMSVKQHDLNALMVGRSRVDRQDGYYVQATYGFLPRWRAGVRWEQIGLTNETRYPDDSSEDFGDSYRLAGMLDFTPTEFSRLRVQVSRGTLELETSDEDVWELYVQWMISLGTHGAHKF